MSTAVARVIRSLVFLHSYMSVLCSFPWLVARSFDIDQFPRSYLYQFNQFKETSAISQDGCQDVLTFWQLVVRHSQLALIDSGQCLPAWLACVR